MYNNYKNKLWNGWDASHKQYTNLKWFEKHSTKHLDAINRYQHLFWSDSNLTLKVPKLKLLSPYRHLIENINYSKSITMKHLCGHRHRARHKHWYADAPNIFKKLYNSVLSYVSMLDTMRIRHRNTSNLYVLHRLNCITLI